MNRRLSLPAPATKTMEDEIFPTAFYFTVRIGPPGNQEDTSFQSASGISVEMETQSYNEGGENAFTYRLPKGVKHQNLVLSRGLAPSSSPLVQWCRDTIEAGLAKPIVTKPLQVLLLDERGNPLRGWSFSGAYPVKWQTENFDSLTNKIAIEKIEFAFNGFTRSDN